MPSSPSLRGQAALIHPEPLTVGQTLELGREVVRALRQREVNVKESFTLGDAGGAWFRASLLSAGSTGGTAKLFERMPLSPESPVAVTLLCAVFARQRMLQVMQKATELGVAAIQPIFTERSVAPEGLEHEKAHGWPGQVLRAVKQCRRSSVPALHAPLSLAEALAQPEWTAADLRLVLDERLPGTTSLEPGPVRVVLAVGPEGGWTDAESALLQGLPPKDIASSLALRSMTLAATGSSANSLGAQPLSLGGRILRAETAVMVGLTVVQHRLGDLGQRGPAG